LVKLEDKYNCPPKTYWPGPKDAFLIEEYDYGYFDDGSHSCRSSGVETKLNPNEAIITSQSYQSEWYRENLNKIKSPFLTSYQKVADSKCSFDTLTCDQGRYDLVNGECYHLAYRECVYPASKIYGGEDLPACCSDKVDMSYCRQDLY
jgi:hypothetical protein